MSVRRRGANSFLQLSALPLITSSLDGGQLMTHCHGDKLSQKFESLIPDNHGSCGSKTKVVDTPGITESASFILLRVSSEQVMERI